MKPFEKILWIVGLVLLSLADGVTFAGNIPVLATIKIPAIAVTIAAIVGWVVRVIFIAVTGKVPTPIDPSKPQQPTQPQP